MKKIIKITESDINRVVTEVVNEIGYKTLDNAAKSAEGVDIGKFVNPEVDPYWASVGTKIHVGEISDAINVIKEALRYYGEKNRENRYNVGDASFSAPEGSSGQYQAALNGINAVERFFIRKLRQQQNLRNTVDDIDDNMAN